MKFVTFSPFPFYAIIHNAFLTGPEAFCARINFSALLPAFQTYTKRRNYLPQSLFYLHCFFLGVFQ